MIKKVPLAGGPTVTIARTAFKGGTWGPDDTIYFANGAGLLKVAATGGEPQKVTNLDVKRREVDQVFPEVLPGGKALLYTARTMEQPSFDEADLGGQPGEWSAKDPGETGNRSALRLQWAPVVYAGSVLLAAPVDAENLEIKGAAVPVVEKILENPRIGAGQYAISKDGLLVYIRAVLRMGNTSLCSWTRREMRSR